MRVTAIAFRSVHDQHTKGETGVFKHKLGRNRRRMEVHRRAHDVEERLWFHKHANAYTRGVSKKIAAAQNATSDRVSKRTFFIHFFFHALFFLCVIHRVRKPIASAYNARIPVSKSACALSHTSCRTTTYEFARRDGCRSHLVDLPKVLECARQQRPSKT